MFDITTIQSTDAQFKTQVSELFGTPHLYIDLNNGIQISVINHFGSYGTEAALIIDGSCAYIPGCWGDSVIGEQYTWDALTEDEQEFLSPFTDVWGYITFDELVRVTEIVSKLQRKS